MSKKWKIFLDILIGIAGVALIVCMVIMVFSFGHKDRKKEEQVKTELSIFELHLEEKAYGDIVRHNHDRRAEELTHSERLEPVYTAAEYIHTAFMERVYRTKQDPQKEKEYSEKREKLKAGLGAYETLTNEVDEIIRTAP